MRGSPYADSGFHDKCPCSISDVESAPPRVKHTAVARNWHSSTMASILPASVLLWYASNRRYRFFSAFVRYRILRYFSHLGSPRERCAAWMVAISLARLGSKRTMTHRCCCYCWCWRHYYAAVRRLTAHSKKLSHCRKKHAAPYIGLWHDCVDLYVLCSIVFSIFTRESSYCVQRVLAIAILSVCLFVCLSVTRVDQLKRCKLRSSNLHHRLPERL